MHHETFISLPGDAGPRREIHERTQVRVRSWGGAVLVTGSVAAGCGADDVGEGCDEAAGVRPSAGVGDVGGVVAVGEQDECVIDAQLRAPLVEGHAEFVVEQPAERAGAGSDPLAEFGQ